MKDIPKAITTKPTLNAMYNVSRVVTVSGRDVRVSSIQMNRIYRTLVNCLNDGQYYTV